MAIIKKKDGIVKEYASRTLVDHNQLGNREAYGCHPISAIRKLPEKLSALKDADNRLEKRIEDMKSEMSDFDSNALDARFENVSEKIDLVVSDVIAIEDKAKNIDIEENEDSTFTFTNYNSESKTIQSGFLPDDDTLELNDKKLTLKKLYHSDTLNGLGTEESPLDLNLIFDDETIFKSNNIYSVIGLRETEYKVLTAAEIYAKNESQDLAIDNLENSVNERFVSIDTKNKEQDNKIFDLLTKTKGIGGYLNSVNFGTSTPNQQTLTDYALSQIPSIYGDANKIFNQTKIINEFDNHVWVYNNDGESTPEWSDIGQNTNISDANNKGLHGLVTGSEEEYEGSIDALGHISINGLPELAQRVQDDFDDINYNIGDISKLQEVVSKDSETVNNIIEVLAEHNERILDNFDSANQNVGEISDSIEQIKKNIGDINVINQVVSNDANNITNIIEALGEHNQRIISEFDEINKLTAEVSDLQEADKTIDSKIQDILDNYVDKTDDELINGTKTFTNFNLQIAATKPIQMQAVENADLLIQQSNVSLGTSVAIKSQSIEDAQVLILSAQKGNESTRVDVSDSEFNLYASSIENEEEESSSLHVTRSAVEVNSKSFLYNGSEVATKEDLIPVIQTGNLISANGFTAYQDLNNTTLAANIQDIFKLLNNQNGGSLINLSIKTGNDAIVGDVISIVEQGEGNVPALDIENSQPILAPNSFYYLYPEQIFASGNEYTICFGCKTNYPYGKGIITLKATKNLTTGLFENPTATLAGEAFYIHNNIVYRYYFQDIDILNESIAHLTIKYVYYEN